MTPDLAAAVRRVLAATGPTCCVIWNQKGRTRCCTKPAGHDGGCEEDRGSRVVRPEDAAMLAAEVERLSGLLFEIANLATREP